MFDERTRKWDYAWISIIIIMVLIDAILRNYKPASYVPVTATITSWSTYGGNSFSDYVVDVDYIYNNVKYKNISYEEYKLGWKEGKEITIYVDSMDPSEIYSNRDTRVFIYIVGTLSICFIIQKKQKLFQK